MSISIRQVENAADFRVFFEFPWQLYRDDPNWVPPLLSMRREQLDREKGAAWSYMKGEFFVAYRDDQPVGTIAAFINHRHNEFHDERVGWFGVFEVYDDAEAARALLAAACDWVRAQGYDTIRGPQSFTTHEETGLLVDGFTRPVMLMPYNKPYYERLVLGADFAPVMDAYSFYMSRERAINDGLYDRLKRVTAAVMKRNKVKVRAIDPKNLKRDFALFKDLYNAAWEKNWGFVPMTERELDALIASLGQFFDPHLAFFGYVDDQPAGFVLGIPDFNEVLLKSYPKPGTPELLTLIKALYHWKLRPTITWARVPLLGVKPEYRQKGVDAVLYFHSMDAMIQHGYQHNDSGWILSANQAMVSIASGFGSDIYKTHRWYEKALT